jgi:hypothetical protein
MCTAQKVNSFSFAVQHLVDVDFNFQPPNDDGRRAISASRLPGGNCIRISCKRVRFATMPEG